MLLICLGSSFLIRIETLCIEYFLNVLNYFKPTTLLSLICDFLRCRLKFHLSRRSLDMEWLTRGIEGFLMLTSASNTDRNSHFILANITSLF